MILPAPSRVVGTQGVLGFIDHTADLARGQMSNRKPGKISDHVKGLTTPAEFHEFETPSGTSLPAGIPGQQLKGFVHETPDTVEGQLQSTKAGEKATQLGKRSRKELEMLPPPAITSAQLDFERRLDEPARAKDLGKPAQSAKRGTRRARNVPQDVDDEPEEAATASLQRHKRKPDPRVVAEQEKWRQEREGGGL